MSALIPVDINGVSHEAHGEFTSSAVASEFQNSLAAFRNIFIIGLDQRGKVDPDSPTLSSAILTELEDTQYGIQLKNALNGGSVTLNYSLVNGVVTHEPRTVLGLLNLAKDGMVVNNDPVLRPGTHFLSVEMAGALEQLIKTLQMAGVNIQTVDGKLQVVGDITATMVKNWKNLSVSSDAVRSIMQYAIDTSGNQNRTLQALVELIYVRTGNDILSDSLEKLEDALSVTKTSLDLLNRLQVLHNKITAEDKQKFHQVYPGTNLSPTDYVSGLPTQAGPHFAGIDPTLLSDVTEQDRIEFLSLRTSLIQEITKLEAQTGQNESGSLLERMRLVLGDINKAMIDANIDPDRPVLPGDADHISLALTKWILDSNLVTNTALNISGIEPGAIQRNITAAVSAGQSLNDTQKEEVRRYLFVFEEYYKSASAILTKITQLLERMAQAIAR